VGLHTAVCAVPTSVSTPALSIDSAHKVRKQGICSHFTQPFEDERIRALEALISCPTNSIHAADAREDEMRRAQANLPSPTGMYREKL